MLFIHIMHEYFFITHKFISSKRTLSGGNAGNLYKKQRIFQFYGINLF